MASRFGPAKPRGVTWNGAGGCVINGGGKRRAVIMHLADENNKLSQQRKISPTPLVQV